MGRPYDDNDPFDRKATVTETRDRVYSGQSPEQRDDSRRLRLRAASRELIGTLGYAATSVEKLCAEAKVSTRHFYQLYDNKEGAFLDLYDHLTAQSFTAASQALELTTGEPLADRIAAALVAYVGPMVEDLHVARITFVEAVGVSSKVEERRLSFREGVIGMIVGEGTAAVARGEATDRDFRFAGLALVGAINAIVYDWAQRSERESHVALESALTALAVTLLAG
jgi:AcrR family transcriptional regulator